MLRGDHIEAVEEAVEYIGTHLDGDLRLETIADAACFSRHYFNRLFSAVTGESIHSFVRRLRLERAAYELFNRPELDITAIALEAGYSPSNFATAFRSAFGLSPSEYRETPSPAPDGAYEEARARIASVRRGGSAAVLAEIEPRVGIVELPAMRLYRRRYVGPYSGLQQAWCSFCEHAAGALPPIALPRYVGISYGDPLITEGSRLRYDLCLVLPEGMRPPPSRPRPLSVPARRYARYRFKAPLSELIYVFFDLVAIWMPSRGLRLAGGPILELYSGGLDAEGRMPVDVCAPIEE
jgi:AraC family transcriptional regulator